MKALSERGHLGFYGFALQRVKVFLQWSSLMGRPVLSTAWGFVSGNIAQQAGLRASLLAFHMVELLLLLSFLPSPSLSEQEVALMSHEDRWHIGSSALSTVALRLGAWGLGLAWP